MESSPIRVTTINDEVYDRLHGWIMNGTLSPGERISTRSIADSLEVSTMPVREAFRRLESNGLVVFGRRSVTVAALSDDEVVQLYQIRLRLERLVAEWALRRIDDADVADLERILDEMVVPDIRFEDWRALNQKFHRRFYDCAGSPHLLEILRGLLDKVEPYMAVFVSTVEDLEEADREHREILDAIRRRDLEDLMVQTENHLASTIAIVHKALAGSRS